MPFERYGLAVNVAAKRAFHCSSVSILKALDEFVVDEVVFWWPNWPVTPYLSELSGSRAHNCRRMAMRRGLQMRVVLKGLCQLRWQLV